MADTSTIKDLKEVQEFKRISERSAEGFSEEVTKHLSDGWLMLQLPFVTDEGNGTYRLNVCDLYKSSITRTTKVS